MAKSEVTYQESTQLRVLAHQLRERYYLHLGHVDLDTVFFAEKTGDKPKKAGIIELGGVKSPWLRQVLERSANHQRYCIAAWGNDWGFLDDTVKEWLLFDMLYSIDPDAEGAIRKRDVVEHGVIASYLGVYWREETVLPSLLSSPEPLNIPPPPICEDDGDSTLSDDE